jgi:hypothetical protein
MKKTKKKNNQKATKIKKVCTLISKSTCVNDFAQGHINDKNRDEILFMVLFYIYMYIIPQARTLSSYKISDAIQNDHAFVFKVMLGQELCFISFWKVSIIIKWQCIFICVLE